MIPLLSDYNVPGGPLPYSGLDVSAPVLIAVAIIIAALIVRAR